MMNRSNWGIWEKILLLCCVSVLFFFSCKKKPQQILVAKVDNKNIFADAIVEKFRNSSLAKNSATFSRNKAMMLLQNIIDGQLIFNEAVRRGFVDDVRIKKSLANIRNLVYYRAAIAQFVGKGREKANQEVILKAESQQLLQKYGLVLNEETIEKQFLALKKKNRRFNADENLMLAEFDGGKIFVADLQDNPDNLKNIVAFRNHILAIARKKVFAVWAIKNNLHTDAQISKNVEARQKAFICEKFELVQFNRFLKSIDKERVNISNAPLASYLKKLNLRQKKRWNDYRLAWIESLKQRHKILLSEKGLELTIVKIQRLATR